MDYNEFEYPRPVLVTDVDEIDIETDGEHDGAFKIKNTGGSAISGQIIARGTAVSFAPTTFEGAATVTYHVDARKYQAGDIIRTGAVILSNGGEKYLPITIRVSLSSILTPEGKRVGDVRGFADYAKNYPTQAAKLLYTEDFRAILIRSRFEYMDLYERSLTDPNPERAAERFLRLCGLKRPAKIVPLQTQTEIYVSPFDRKKYIGSIPIKQEGWGYVSDTVAVQNKSPWLTALSGVRHALENAGMLAFSVDPALISNRYSADAFLLSDQPGALTHVTVVRRPFFIARTDRESYGISEMGSLLVNNYTGQDLLLEIDTSEPFVSFEARGHYIGEQAHIPFMIKPTAFQALSLRKAFATVYILVKTRVRDEYMGKRLEIVVGGYN
ncbi:MAG: DUF5717 family protein [Clostridiales bacterium]|jgi:hypothetical protein|nr:DUF5717 family protein [Clostridiales bacterium]